MKIGLTGATGLVGKNWTKRANAAGDAVVGFTRSASQQIEGCIETRPFSSNLDISGLNAIVHMAGESILGLWTHKKKRAVLESRIKGTRAVVDAIGRLPASERPEVLVSASAIGYYGVAGDAKLTEESPPGAGFMAEVCEAWETQVLRAEQFGVRVVALRIGLVLAREAMAVKNALPIFKLGLGGQFGDGRQWMSWIHLDDLVEMIQVAVHDKTVSGVWNATAPEPVRNSEFTRALACAVGRPAIFTAPALPIRLLLGELSDVLLKGVRVIPARPLAHGFRFLYSDIGPALKECV